MMSEREVREELEGAQGTLKFLAHSTNQSDFLLVSKNAQKRIRVIDKALSADPDLVELLRYLVGERRSYEIVLDENELLPDEVGDWVARGYWARDLERFIERKFGVRLTETGWEYVEGEDE